MVASGTLDGVTVVGTLTLGYAQSVTLVDGTVAVPSGTGTSEIDVTGPSATLRVGSGETLDDVTVVLGSISYGSATLYSAARDGTALTLGSGATLAVTGAGVLEGDATVNDGMVAVTGQLRTSGELDNAGTLAVSAGASVTIDSVFDNTGLVMLDGGALLDLSSGSQVNRGSIAVGSGTTLQLGYYGYGYGYGYTTLDNAGGLVALDGGTLDGGVTLSGGTLTLAD